MDKTKQLKKYRTLISPHPERARIDGSNLFPWEYTGKAIIEDNKMLFRGSLGGKAMLRVPLKSMNYAAGVERVVKDANECGV